MESILDKVIQKMDALEKKIEEYEVFQSEIQKLEAYYTSQQWKDDFAADEAEVPGLDIHRRHREWDDGDICGG